MNLNATILGQALAFIIFVWLCMKYVWPFLIEAIEQRQKNIAEGLESADKARKELQLANSNSADILEKAKEESQLIIEQAGKMREAIIEKAQIEAEKERSKIVAQGMAEIEAESKRVREELRNKVAMLAFMGAEKIIERSVDKSANNDIVDKLIAEL